MKSLISILINTRQATKNSGSSSTLKIVIVVALMLFVGEAAIAQYRLHILHVNDIHSRLEPVSRFNSTCKPEQESEGKCFGGIARVAFKINELRDDLLSKGENVVVLDAGDQFQGSLIFTFYRGEAAAEFMEAIGFDAMVVGNHEFDHGPKVLADFIDNVTFPVVGGNLDLQKSDDLKSRINDHLVLEIGGEKIGIVSAVTTDTVQIAKPGPDVVFLDEIESLQEDVKILESKGIDKIIALTHVGLERDLEIASNVVGLDAIIGGHSHTLLSNTASRREREYPVMVQGKSNVMVPVVQAYAYSKYVGHLVLEFDDTGGVTEAYGDTIILDRSAEKDLSIASRLEELLVPVHEYSNLVVAEASKGISGDAMRCRRKECPMGNLVADAMLDSKKDDGFSIAIQNGGGIRASIDKGGVTIGEILTVLPYQNTIATFQTTGSVIKEALEHGISATDEFSGRFPQVSGLKFSWSSEAPDGSRVNSIYIYQDGDWQPLDPAATYGVVTNDFIRQGGDGYKMFQTAAEVNDFGQNLEEAVVEYLKKFSPYSPYTDGRIRRGND